MAFPDSEFFMLRCGGVLPKMESLELSFPCVRFPLPSSSPGPHCIPPLKNVLGASLVVQRLRIHLPMQGTRVRALVWEDPTCCGATRPVSHNY